MFRIHFNDVRTYIGFFFFLTQSATRNVPVPISLAFRIIIRYAHENLFIMVYCYILLLLSVAIVTTFLNHCTVCNWSWERNANCTAIALWTASTWMINDSRGFSCTTWVWAAGNSRWHMTAGRCELKQAESNHVHLDIRYYVTPKTANTANIM